MRAVIFVNGELEDAQQAAALIKPHDYLIAADGGLRHMRAMGLMPRLLVGDLDSVSAEEILQVEQSGGEILRFQQDKDFTDLELAVRAARQRGCDHILLVAALGGRLDQMLANISLLTQHDLAGLRIELDDGRTQVYLVRDSLQFKGQAGDTVSLLPWGLPARGVVTFGLKYPLKAETLLPGDTRGISNRMLGESAGVELQKGLLMCVRIRQLEAPKLEE